MELKLTKTREMPLLSRKRLTYHMAFKGPVPARLLIIKAVAKEAKVDESLVIVKHIYPGFGIEEANVIAVVYENADILKKLETQKLIAKHSEKKEEAKEGS